MKNIFIIVGISFVLAALYVYVRPAPPVPDGYSRLPVVETEQESVDSGRIAVPSSDGEAVDINDPTIDASALNETTYEFSGDAPQLEKTYNLTFYEDQGFFLVSLLTEPLGAVRAEAEAALRAKLGVTQEELCSLNISVRTDLYTNQFYAGNELGISDCPGSISLPQ